MSDCSDLAEINRRIRNVGARLKRMRKEAAGDPLDSNLATLILMVFVFSGHDFNTAAGYVLARNVVVEADAEDAERVVESVYCRMPTQQITSLMNDSCLSEHCQSFMKEACRFIVQYRLFGWLKEQNCQRGVAPSRAQLIRYALSVLPEEAPPSIQQHVAQPLRGSARMQRKWLQSFRQKWDAKLGKLRVASTVPQHVKTTRETKNPVARLLFPRTA